MSKLLSASLLTCLLIQGFTYPPVHGFSPDQIALMLAEGAGLLLCLLTWMKGGILFGVGMSGALFHFWPLLSQWSWEVSSIIHRLSGWFAEAMGIGFGVSVQGFRIDGVLVTADPSKTGALAFLVWMTIFLCQTLFENGASPGLSQVAQAAVLATLFAIARWLGFAAFLGWAQPNLVFHAWHLFWGFGLTLSLLSLSLLLASSPGRLATMGTGHPVEVSPAATAASPPAEPSPPMGGKLLLGWVVLLIVSGLFARVSGSLGSEENPISVLIDETHSAWEPVRVSEEQEKQFVFDENNFGGWVSSLEQIASVTVAYPPGTPIPHWEFQATQIFTKELNPEFLAPSKLDLLILKCPTTPYSPAEQAAILKFVEEGGTLWAIGEHTDVFFINTSLNEILASVGAKLRSDGVCDHAGRWLVTNGPLHSSEPWAPGQNPYMWATGASIQGDFRMVPLAVSSPDAFSDGWDPSKHNFFGRLEPDAAHLYGPFTLAAMVPWKKGKIIIHGDSTNFNCSMLSSPGKRELTRNVVGSSRHGVWRSHVGVLLDLAFSLVTCLFLGRLLREERSLAAWGVSAIFLALFCGGFLSNSLWGKSFPENGIPLPRMLIDLSLKPAIGLNYGHQQKVTAADSFDPALVQLQRLRLDMAPSWQPLKNVLSNHVRALLLADPVLLPDARDLQALREWVLEGGLAIMVSSSQPAGPIRTMALCLGLEEAFSRSLPIGDFLDLSSPKCFGMVNEDELPMTFHKIGSGSVCLISHWSDQNQKNLDYQGISRILVDAMGLESSNIDRDGGRE